MINCNLTTAFKTLKLFFYKHLFLLLSETSIHVHTDSKNSTKTCKNQWHWISVEYQKTGNLCLLTVTVTDTTVMYLVIDFSVNNSRHFVGLVRSTCKTKTTYDITFDMLLYFLRVLIDLPDCLLGILAKVTSLVLI